MDNEKFGKFMVELRKEKNMTQKDVANQFNLTDKAISKWERGLSFPDISMLKPLAEFFEVSILELMNGQRDKSQEVNIDEKVLQILKQVEKEKNKKIRKVIGISFVYIIIFVIIFLILGISKIKLYTYNPIRAIIGYVQVMAFHKEYTEVGNIPTKTIYASTKFDIEKYMKDRGYTKLEERTIKTGDDVYTNGENSVLIERYVRRGIVIYEWNKKQPYSEKNVEKEKIETEIKIPTLNDINRNNLINDIV